MIAQHQPSENSRRGEWVGNVPRHWNVCPLNFRYEVALGKMLDEKQMGIIPLTHVFVAKWDRRNIET